MNKRQIKKMKKLTKASEELKQLLDIFGRWDFDLQWKGDCYILQTYFETPNGQKIIIYFIVSDDGAHLGVWGENSSFTYEQLSEKADAAQFDFLAAVIEIDETTLVLETMVDWAVLEEQPLITVFWMLQMADVMMDAEYEMA